MNIMRRASRFCCVHLLAFGLLVAGPGAACAGLSAAEACAETAKSPACCCPHSAELNCNRACCSGQVPDRPQAPPVEQPQKLPTSCDALCGSRGTDIADASGLRGSATSPPGPSVVAASLTLHGLGVRLQT
jgi:hypothetical protein